jgi:hypothetical protein
MAMTPRWRNQRREPIEQFERRERQTRGPVRPGLPQRVADALIGAPTLMVIALPHEFQPLAGNAGRAQ